MRGLFRCSLQIFVTPFLIAIATVHFIDIATAQVTTTITPSGLGTRVALPKPSAEGLVHEITGGTRIETNLYHGLGRLDLAAGEIANFLNDSGLATSNIFGRVTGGQPSLIFGTLRTTDFPGANLYLMNPAGVLFGSTAVIDLGAISTAPGTREGGSFFLTTADYIRLADGAQFHANPAEPRTSFSASPAAAFGFLIADPTAISIQGTTIQVAETQSLSLVGGNRGFTAESGETAPAGVTLVGATLTAPTGRIQLASVASAGEVLIDTWTTGPNVENVSFSGMGTVRLADGSLAQADGNPNGSVRILGQDVSLDHSTLRADALGDQANSATAIKVMAEGSLDLTTGSELSSSSFGVTPSGDLDLSARNILIADGSRILTGSFLEGSAGNISATATESITISGVDPDPTLNEPRSRIQSLSESAIGSTGTVIIDTPSVRLVDRGVIKTDALEGQAGDIRFNVTDLSLTAGGGIESNGGFLGSSGTIGVMPRGTVRGTVFVNGEATIDPDNPPGYDPHSRIITSNQGEGPTGAISIETGNLIVTGGAFIKNETLSNPTPSIDPKIRITAQDAVLVSGTDLQNIESRIGVDNAGGDVGPFTLSARTVTLGDRASLFTFTRGDGNAGPISIEAQSFSASGGAQVRSDAQSSFGIGRGGDVILAITGHLSLTGTVTDSAGRARPTAVTSRTNGQGDAGNLTINAQTIDVNEGAQVNSNSTRSASGSGGEISLTTSILDVGRTGLITTSTEASGQGGILKIRADQVNVSSGGRIASGSIRATPRSQRDNVPTPSGNAGSVTVQGLASPAQSVLIDGAGSGIFTETQGTGAGGSIFVETNTLIMQNGGTLSAATSGTTDTAVGGNVELSIPQALTMTNGSLITTTSSGPANAGSIIMEDPRPATITMTDSAIIADATAAGSAASGGNITLLATDTIRLLNSQINTSVVGNENTVGGTIFIDPQLVFLQNSQILATAVQGQGGTITIVAGTFLADPSSSVSASSQLGINGTVDIRATVQNLSGALVPLQQDFLAGGSLIAQRCAARATDGQVSSFILAGREGIPAEPDGALASPLEPRSTGLLGPVASSALLTPSPSLAPSPSPLPLRGGEEMVGGASFLQGEEAVGAASTPRGEDVVRFSSLARGADAVGFASLARGEDVAGKAGAPSYPSPLRGEGGVRGGQLLLAAGPGFGTRLGGAPIHAEDFSGACRR